jgi:hypothetical protein
MLSDGILLHLVMATCRKVGKKTKLFYDQSNLGAFARDVVDPSLS